MARLILFNKPCGVLSQFSGDDPATTLAGFIPLPGFYAAGRLDRPSEGLLLLTDDGKLQQRIANPDYHKEKTYLVQVEGEIDEEALAGLAQGVMLNDGPTRPARARRVPQPELWPRQPPIRIRQQIPTSWLELTLTEGRNRQVRRMTAAVGYPTLRLVRTRIDNWKLGKMLPGQWRLLET
ncbi:MAG: pseudouridine synthase [Pseudohongiellaceae bacterium]